MYATRILMLSAIVIGLYLNEKERGICPAPKTPLFFCVLPLFFFLIISFNGALLISIFNVLYVLRHISKCNKEER